MKSLIALTFLFSAVFAQSCVDRNANCGLYKSLGLCKTYVSQMKANCAKTCQYCNTRPQPPTPGQCGRPMNAGSRIIGGEVAKKDAWPWQVSLYYQGQFLCGGSIISSKWILTAAHCVDGFQYYNYKIVVGDYDRRNVDGDEQVYNAVRAFHHPRWNYPTQLNNDVALIELDKPIRFNTHVQPVCLPASGTTVPVGTKCYITGWGQYYIGKTGPPTNVLKQAPLDVVSQSTCTDLNTRNLGITVTNEMICAGIPNSRNSGCHGDSGGPFVCQASDGRWVLQGSVSWGSGTCQRAEAYSVFAKISEFKEWIDYYVN